MLEGWAPQIPWLGAFGHPVVPEFLEHSLETMKGPFTMEYEK